MKYGKGKTKETRKTMHRFIETIQYPFWKIIQERNSKAL
jgi:hypothetical protein